MPRARGGNPSVDLCGDLLEDAFGSSVEVVNDVAQTAQLEQRWSPRGKLRAALLGLLDDARYLDQLVPNRCGQCRKTSLGASGCRQRSSIPSCSAAARKAELALSSGTRSTAKPWASPSSSAPARNRSS